MALGTANDPYPNNNNNDFDNIKNSLKLLKAKKAEQKMQDYPPEPKVTLDSFRIHTEDRTLQVPSSASPLSAKVALLSYRSWLKRLP